MTTRILTGTKAEIAKQLVDLDGEVRQAIVYIDEPSNDAKDGAARRWLASAKGRAKPGVTTDDVISLTRGES